MTDDTSDDQKPKPRYQFSSELPPEHKKLWTMDAFRRGRDMALQSLGGPEAAARLAQRAKDSGIEIITEPLEARRSESAKEQ